MLYVCLFLPSALGVFVLIFDLWRSRCGTVTIVRRAASSVANGKVSPAPVPQTAAGNIARTINCPKCKRVFGKPLSMLDFSSGKAQQVNVCPYCNHVLGDAVGVDVNVRVVGPDEREEVRQRR